MPSQFADFLPELLRRAHRATKDIPDRTARRAVALDGFDAGMGHLDHDRRTAVRADDVHAQDVYGSGRYERAGRVVVPGARESDTVVVRVTRRAQRATVLVSNHLTLNTDGVTVCAPRDFVHNWILRLDRSSDGDSWGSASTCPRSGSNRRPIVSEAIALDQLSHRGITFRCSPAGLEPATLRVDFRRPGMTPDNERLGVHRQQGTCEDLPDPELFVSGRPRAGPNTSC